MPQNKTRLDVPMDTVANAVEDLKKQLVFRLEQKGKGTFASSHEILGIITEEYHELVEAVRLHGDEKARRIKSELMDIAVACVFGAACINEGKMDWL